MIGGLGPLSTIYYYERLVENCRNICGHAPRLLVYTIPVEHMCKAVKEGDLDTVARLLREAIDALANGGAQVAFIAANTPHIAWNLVEPYAREKGLKLVSIVEAALHEALEKGYHRLVIAGTRKLIESRIYQDRFREAGLEVVEPDEHTLLELDEMITRLAHGRIDDKTVEHTVKLLERLEKEADAILLACTELPMLLKRVGIEMRVVDTVEAQVRKAIRAWLATSS